MSAAPDTAPLDERPHAGDRLTLLWQRLCLDGLALDAGQLADAQALAFLHFTRDGPDADSERLRRMIEGVFAKSRAEQRAYEAAWFEIWGAPPEPEVEAPSPVEDLSPTPQTTRPWRFLLGGVLTALSAAALIALIFFFRPHPPSGGGSPPLSPPPGSGNLPQAVTSANPQSSFVGLELSLIAAALVAVVVLILLRARAARPAWRRMPYQSVEDRLETHGARPGRVRFFEARGARTLSRQLRNARSTEAVELDVVATVDATARHAGAFVPVYLPIRSAVGAHVLIERLSRHDHVSALFANAVDRLRAGGARIEKHFFFGNVDTLLGEDAQLARLRDVAQPDGAALIVVGTPAALLDDDSGRVPRPRRRALARWGRRFLLDTRRIRHWDRAEERVMRAGFAVGPPTLNGLLDLANALGAPRQIVSLFGVRQRPGAARPPLSKSPPPPPAETRPVA